MSKQFCYHTFGIQDGGQLNESIFKYLSSVNVSVSIIVASKGVVLKGFIDKFDIVYWCY